MSDLIPPSPPIQFRWFLWTFAALSIFAVIGFYSVQMANHGASFDDQRGPKRLADRLKLDSEAQAVLTTADWVDQDKKIVRIPIDEAMTKEVDALKTKPASMGEAIPAEAPPAASAPAAAASTNTAPASAPATNAPPAAPAKTTNK